MPLLLLLLFKALHQVTMQHLILNIKGPLNPIKSAKYKNAISSPFPFYRLTYCYFFQVHFECVCIIHHDSVFSNTLWLSKWRTLKRNSKGKWHYAKIVFKSLSCSICQLFSVCKKWDICFWKDIRFKCQQWVMSSDQIFILSFRL